MPNQPPVPKQRQRKKAKAGAYRYRWNKQCVCGSFLRRPADDATSAKCPKCGQEYEVGR